MCVCVCVCVCMCARAWTGCTVLDLKRNEILRELEEEYKKVKCNWLSHVSRVESTRFPKNNVL